ncbi:MAG: RNA ligase [Methanosarcinales archaeon]
MDVKKIARKLNLPESRINELLERRIIKTISDELFYFAKGISGIESGTFIFCKDDIIEIIQGYPKIRRAMVLDACIKNHFASIPVVAVEEKMNGYNVRVCLLKNKIYAITRGGLICPYTTEKARELIGYNFFRDYPHYVLCGEMVGPDNPYVPKNIYNIDSLDFFIFDIQEKNTGYSMSVLKKHALLKEYELNAVRFFGVYSIPDASSKIMQIIKELGAIFHEGVVIKDPEMILPPIKYTCSQSNCIDLEYAFAFYNDYGKDFFFSRVVREGFQSVELNENDIQIKERCCRLGESILKPMINTIKRKKSGKRIVEKVQIRVKNLETAKQFEEHLRNLNIDAIFESPIFINGEYLIKIKKIYQSTNDKTEAVLKGQTW